MTYDPYPHNRNELPPALQGVVIGVVMLLVAAIGVFIYAGPSDQKFATNDLRPPITQQSTTGSSANMPPAPQPRLEPKVKQVE